MDLSWTLDLKTAILTLLIAPLFYFFLRRLYKFLRRHLQYLLDGFLWFVGRYIVRSLAARTSLRRYCRTQLEAAATKYLQVPGRASLALETDRIFVTLKLEFGGNQEGTFSQGNLLTAGQRVRVVGDPGSGKSSLVKRIFRDACRTAMWEAKDTRLPIIVELKRFTPPKTATDEPELASWAVNELRSTVTAVEGYAMGELFDSYISNNGLLVLLDGLDEVSSEAYERTATAIRALSRRLEHASSENAIILTMRTQFHQQVRDDFADDFPPTLYIRAFSPGEIYTFLNRWPFRHNKARAITRIYSDLTDRPTLREQREAILGRLAYQNLTDANRPPNSLSWREAVEVVSDVYGCDHSGVGERYFRELARDTGIISEERERESFRFIHLTFCEFLAAKECAQGRANGWDDLMAAHRRFGDASLPPLRTRLLEVIPFTCALLPRVQRPDALDEIAKLGDRQVMGRCFLETQAYDHSRWQSYSEEEAASLTEVSEEEWNEDWLRRLHLFNVVLRDAEEWGKHVGRKPTTITLDQVFSILVGSSRQRLIRVFSAYAAQDAGAAFRLAEACGVDLVLEHPGLLIANCTNPPFLAIAMQRAMEERRRTVRWTQILAEAALRSNVVAATLQSSPSPDEWRALVQRVDFRSRWSLRAAQVSVFFDDTDVHLAYLDMGVDVSDTVGPMTDTSYYTDCLTLALSSPSPQHGEEFSALRVLGRVSPPTSLLPAKAINALAAPPLVAGVAFAALGFGLVSDEFLPESLRLSPRSYTLLPPIMFLISSLAVGYTSARSGLYRSLINIDPYYRFMTERPWRWVFHPGKALLFIQSRAAVKAFRELRSPRAFTFNWREQSNYHSEPKEEPVDP